MVNLKRTPEWYCNKCGHKLGRKQEVPNNVCMYCKRRMYITVPLISLSGKPYKRDDNNRPLKTILLNTHVSNTR